MNHAPPSDALSSAERAASPAHEREAPPGIPPGSSLHTRSRAHIGGPAPRAPQRWGNAWTILRRHFSENHLLLRASALTYATLLSAVPFLAVLLSVLRALGIEDQVLPWLGARLRVGGQQTADALLAIAQRLDPAALGALGGVGLLLSALLLLAQVDSAFNAIWGVRERRPIATRLLGYGGILVLGPLWIALWTTAMSSVRLVVTAWPGAWSVFGLTLVRIAGPLLALVVLTALYLVAPNTRVRLRAALVGAIVATFLLELAQVVFVGWIKTSAGYRLLFAQFAALPIFLAWVYFNWLAILLGAEAGYLAQSVPAWLREAEEPVSLAWEERERLALASAALLATGGDWEAEGLAEELEVSPRLVHRPLDDLADAGWIDELTDPHGQPIGYRARPELPGTTLAELRRSLRALGEECISGVRRRALFTTPAWMSVLEPLEREGDRPFESWSTAELAEQLARARRRRDVETRSVS